MPQKITEPIEDKIRKYLVDAIRPSEVEGLDPTIGDTTRLEFLLVTSDYDNYGDTYPLVFVSNNAGTSVIDGGETNISSIQGDGSGNNQNAQYSVTIQCQAVENGPLPNNVDYDVIAFQLFQEVKYQINQAETSDFTNLSYIGNLTPAPVERSSSEQDNSTESWSQFAGTVPVGVHYTP
jgi:hypothetical protein